MRYAIKVIWADGEEEYLSEDVGTRPAVFASKASAERQVEFMRMGMGALDGAQSINVVRAPRDRGPQS